MAKFIYLTDEQWRQIKELELDQDDGADIVLVAPGAVLQLRNEALAAGREDGPELEPWPGGSDHGNYSIGEDATRIEFCEGPEHNDALNAIRAELGLQQVVETEAVAVLDLLAGVRALPAPGEGRLFYQGRPVKELTTLGDQAIIEFADREEFQPIDAGEFVEIR